MPRSFSNKWHSETQVSGRLGMSGGRSLDMPRTPYRASEGNTLNNPPCPITPTLRSSVHLLISSIDYNVFIVIQCHLKDFSVLHDKIFGIVLPTYYSFCRQHCHTYLEIYERVPQQYFHQR